MTNRRTFLLRTTAAAIAGSASFQIAETARSASRLSKAIRQGDSALLRVRSAIWRDDTVLDLGGDVAGLQMTWTADDRQLVCITDSGGWVTEPKDHYYSTRVCAISGGPKDATFQDLPGYPDIKVVGIIKGGSLYYGFNVLAVDGQIYQYLSTNPKYHWVNDPDPLHWTGAKLIYSPNNGQTWCNQDGSNPVVLELPKKQSRQNMVFLDETQDVFSLNSFLQMGRDYQGNRDGYVYVYSPNGITDGTMNELVMFRVRKDRVLDRSHYEYFAARTRNAGARWTKDINARGVVHTFPRGWVNSYFPMSWMPCVVYNAPLGVYMMGAGGSRYAAHGEPTAGYFGFWIATNPWGPWWQIYESSGDNARNGLIAPKWVAENGRSFWVAWSSNRFVGPESERSNDTNGVFTEDEFVKLRELWRKDHPDFSFHAQRVDLVVT